jgi:hypothetical protein
MEMLSARAQAASVLACAFLTVETAFLQRIYILFFNSLATRRIEYGACTSNPGGRWVAQQARNLVMQFGDEQPFRFVVHDRDAKFGYAFDAVFRSEGIKVDRCSSSAATTSSMSSASTAAVTTRLGRTARCNWSRPTGAARRRQTRPIAYAAATSSTDSSMNTRPPEFANPTGARASAGLGERNVRLAAPASVAKRVNAELLDYGLTNAFCPRRSRQLVGNPPDFQGFRWT